MNRRDAASLDRYITGNRGEDQLDSLCVICGRTFRVEDRPLHPDVDPDDVDTCSPACDSEASYRLVAEHEGEGVPLKQSEEDELLNGAWKKGRKS